MDKKDEKKGGKNRKKEWRKINQTRRKTEV